MLVLHVEYARANYKAFMCNEISYQCSYFISRYIIYFCNNQNIFTVERNK